jgi:carboxyl-terminal processing protease
MAKPQDKCSGPSLQEVIGRSVTLDPTSKPLQPEPSGKPVAFAASRGVGSILFRNGLRSAVLGGLVFSAGALFSHLSRATTEAESPYYLVDQLARALVLVENDYVDPVDRSRLLEGAIKGMVAELDPHSSYLPADDYAIFQGDTEGRFGGIGVEVDFATDFVLIIGVIETSPAESAGIRPGDRIVAIDGQSIRGRSPTDLVKVMRGEPGSKVLLTIRRDGADDYLYFTLTRQVINVSSVASKMLAGDVAYLRIKMFQHGTHTEILDQVAKLRQQTNGALRGVVLDLRNNPGGLVDEATAIADEFLEQGVIFTTRRRGKVVDEVLAAPGGALRGLPAAVLLNEFSASASELVAGSLQDNRRATVVGATSFGKGSVQSIIDLPGGSGLRLTTLRYYTPNGRAIQAQGVRPDLAVAAAPGDYGIVREKNLENHLPADEGAERNWSPAVTELPPDADAGSVPTTESVDHGVARKTPTDPRGGPDKALDVAYQVVTGTYGKTRSTPPATPGAPGSPSAASPAAPPARP